MTREHEPALGPVSMAPVAGAALEAELGAFVDTPRRLVGVRRVLRTTSGKVGVALLGLVLAVAVVGPLVAPHDIGEVVGVPLEGPRAGAPLGTDILGRDVLSRFLAGGWLLLVVSSVATAAAYLVGGTLGMIAGYRRGLGDLGLVGTANVLISIPPIILALVLVAALGGGVTVVGLAVAIVLTPGLFRLVRSWTIAVTTSEYVEAAVAQGEPFHAVLWRDVLPNLRVSILADVGIRMSYAIMLFAALNFLGLGESPPAANWGLMISENRLGLVTDPLPVIVPALGIALLTIAVNLVADALARSTGRSSGVA